MDWVAAGTEIRSSISLTQFAAGMTDKVPIGSYDANRFDRDGTLQVKWHEKNQFQLPN